METITLADLKGMLPLPANDPRRSSPQAESCYRRGFEQGALVAIGAVRAGLDMAHVAAWLALVDEWRMGDCARPSRPPAPEVAP